VKEVADVIKKAGDIELYRKIIEAEGEIIELTRKNRHLEEEVQQLKEKLALRGAMQFKEPFYYQKGDQTPYCPACWETKQAAVHVTLIYDEPIETRWDCPHCKQMYLIKNKSQRNLGVPGLYGPPTSDWG
jgi:hypothetical protein